jgi:uncharacterized protein
MTLDAAHAMSDRLRADLRAALKAGRSGEAQVIRGLIAAIDNAQAPPLPTDRAASDQISFAEGSAEVERLSLGRAQLRALLLAEIGERERAAAEFDHLGRQDRADDLRAEIAQIRPYLD